MTFNSAYSEEILKLELLYPMVRRTFNPSPEHNSSVVLVHGLSVRRLNPKHAASFPVQDCDSFRRNDIYCAVYIFLLYCVSHVFCKCLFSLVRLRPVPSIILV